MPASRNTTHLDPRSPFVLDTRELGRRPGSMRRVRTSIPAPEGWALELVRVPVGAEIALDLRLEAVMEGVLVSGTVRGPVVAECGRCLDPVEASFEADVQELYAYDAADAEDEGQVLDGDRLDLQPVLRDAVVLGLPINPVCDDDCSGLCATCGVRLADVGADHAHDDLDPRWASLAALRADTPDPASPEIGR